MSFRTSGPHRHARRPDSAGQTDAGSECGPSADSLKFREWGGRNVPGFLASQHARRPIDAPEGAVFPTETFANGLQDPGGCLAQCFGLGQDTRRRLMCREAPFGLVTRVNGALQDRPTMWRFHFADRPGSQKSTCALTLTNRGVSTVSGVSHEPPGMKFWL